MFKEEYWKERFDRKKFREEKEKEKEPKVIQFFKELFARSEVETHPWKHTRSAKERKARRLRHRNRMWNLKH
jgi:hypothetical protein